MHLYQAHFLISGWPRFGSVRLRFGDGNGSSGSGFRFRRFLQGGGSCVFQYSFTGRTVGSGSGFGSWKTVPAVPVQRSVPAKTVPAVPVSGSGSVPGPPCNFGKVTSTALELTIFTVFSFSPGERNQTPNCTAGLRGFLTCEIGTVILSTILQILTSVDSHTFERDQALRNS